MNFIVFLAGFLLGSFISSFTIIPIFIIFRFGIPTTKTFVNRGWIIKNNGIIKKYFISVAILFIIYCSTILITKNISHMLYSGVIWSSILTLIFGIGKTTANKDNMADFLDTNKNKLTDEGKKTLTLNG